MPIGMNIMMMHEIIADNVTRLIEHYEKTHGGKLTQARLAVKSGLSQRTISNVLRPGSVESITTETIDKLAKFFGLEPFLLVVPNLPVDESNNGWIEKVISCYTKASTDGRENIKRTAENEVRYLMSITHSK